MRIDANLQGTAAQEGGLEGTHLLCLGLGSNIQPKIYLPSAIRLLCNSVQLIAVSNAWESPSDGSEGPNFLNAALLARTKKLPEELKSQVLRPVEEKLGRVRTADKNAPRTIDLDILVYDKDVLDEMLWERPYLAVPVAELLPDLFNPVTGEFLADAAARLMQGCCIQLSSSQLSSAINCAGPDAGV